jgi:hypothetical protein
MVLSIIIVSYNGKSLLQRCLNSIYRYRPSISFEIIVVDNNSKDATIEMIKKNFKKVKIIRNTRNIGFARANNQAIARAKGEYLLFLNPDTLVADNSIDKMVQFLEKRKNIGCIGPKLVYPDGSLQLSCRRFPTLINVFFGRKSIFTRFFPNNPMTRDYLLTDLDYSKIQKVDWVIGAAFMVKREIIDIVGNFDEDFFLFVEDTDFCYRLHQVGIGVYYFPEAQIIHNLGAITEKYWMLPTISHNFGMYKFFLKHYRLSIFVKWILFLGLIFRIFYIILMKSITERTKG